MTVFYTPVASAFGQNIVAAAGSKLFFFEVGTTTPKTSFSDAAETIPNTDPVIADGSGRFIPIFISGTYDVELQDANDVQIWKALSISSSGVVGNVIFLGGFDSSTNAGDYPASGSKGDLFVVTTGFTLNAASGSHILSTRDFIIANIDGATGVDADWDIIRGVNAARTSDIVVTIFDINRAYNIGEYVKATDNKLYRALVAQAGNNPAGGGDPTNWLPFGDLLNILTSTDTTRGLTAAQGKVLKDLIDLPPTPATTTVKGADFIFERIILSNGADISNDINFASGNFFFSDGSGSANLPTQVIKQLDNTWALGTNLGGLAAGISKAPLTTYHCFMMSNAVGTIVDAGFDTSITATNLSADPVAIAAFGASFKTRLVGSILTDATPDIRNFTQTGRLFTLGLIVRDIATTVSTTRANFAMTVPLGRKVGVIMNSFLVANGANGFRSLIISDPDGPDQVPTIGNLGVYTISFQKTSGNNEIAEIHITKTSNTLSQIGFRSTNAVDDLNVSTEAWIDYDI